MGAEEKTMSGGSILDYRSYPVYARNGKDFYRETQKAAEAVLDYLQPTGTIWDPACGKGRIVLEARRRGLTCLASDIVDRGCPDSRICDFTKVVACWQDVDWIVANPPFKLIETFIRRAVEIAPDVVMMGQLTLLEGQKRGKNLWPVMPFYRVLVHSSRVSMPPGDIEDEVKAEGGNKAFAWYWFKRNHKALATVDFLP